MADYSDSIYDIDKQTHHAKESHEGAERLLHPIRPFWCKEAVAGIESFHHVLHRPVKTVRTGLFLQLHHDPVS